MIQVKQPPGETPGLPSRSGAVGIAGTCSRNPECGLAKALDRMAAGGHSEVGPAPSASDLPGPNVVDLQECDIESRLIDIHN